MNGIVSQFNLNDFHPDGLRIPAKTLPVVSLSKAKSDQPNSLTKLGQQLFYAFYHTGFAILVDHGVNPADVKAAFNMSTKLFDLPTQEKLKMAYTTTERNRGYIGFRGETLEGTGTSAQRTETDLSNGALPDLKESFDIGSKEDNAWSDIWPEILMPEFRTVFYQLRKELDGIHKVILSVLAFYMKLPCGYFEPFFDKKEYSLRLLHYPQIPQGQDLKFQQKRAGTHTDYNSITMLLQDDVGGLQVLNSANQWIDVKPVPNSIIVNTGDLMERWTNGLLRSTVHQVVEPELKDTDHRQLKPRYSMAYFVKPNRDARIECLPTCENHNTPARYPPVNCFEYVNNAFKQANNEYQHPR